MATETELYHAWRLLDAVARGKAANLEQRTEYVAPAQAILGASLTELGFSIVDGILVPTGEVPPEGFLPEDFQLGTRLRPDQGLPPAEIDNTLPPEGGDLDKPPPGTAPPLGGEDQPGTEQQSAEHHERKRRR